MDKARCKVYTHFPVDHLEPNIALDRMLVGGRWHLGGLDVVGLDDNSRLNNGMEWLLVGAVQP